MLPNEQGGGVPLKSFWIIYGMLAKCEYNICLKENGRKNSGNSSLVFAYASPLFLLRKNYFNYLKGLIGKYFNYLKGLIGKIF